MLIFEIKKLLSIGRYKQQDIKLRDLSILSIL